MSDHVRRTCDELARLERVLSGGELELVTVCAHAVGNTMLALWRLVPPDDPAGRAAWDKHADRCRYHIDRCDALLGTIDGQKHRRGVPYSANWLRELLALARRLVTLTPLGDLPCGVPTGGGDPDGSLSRGLRAGATATPARGIPPGAPGLV